LKRAGAVKIDRADLNTTLRRGWCFGSQEFKEKLDVLLGKKISEGNTYRVENGYDGQQLRGHDERAAQQYIETSLSMLGLERSELSMLPKMDVRKALIARLLRRKTQVGLEWIARELKMGVRSSVSRAEKQLVEKMNRDKKLQKQWRKLEMQQISS